MPNVATSHLSNASGAASALSARSQRSATNGSAAEPRGTGASSSASGPAAFQQSLQSLLSTRARKSAEATASATAQAHFRSATTKAAGAEKKNAASTSSPHAENSKAAKRPTKIHRAKTGRARADDIADDAADTEVDSHEASGALDAAAAQQLPATTDSLVAEEESDAAVSDAGAETMDPALAAMLAGAGMMRPQTDDARSCNNAAEESASAGGSSAALSPEQSDLAATAATTAESAEAATGAAATGKVVASASAHPGTKPTGFGVKADATSEGEATADEAANPSGNPSAKPSVPTAAAPATPTSAHSPSAAATDAQPSTARDNASPADRLANLYGFGAPAQQSAAHSGHAIDKATASIRTPNADAAFAAANGPSIVTAISGKAAVDGGGAIHLRLDPPELGALQVAVVMKDGLASISFQAADPEAAKLITQSLGELRDALSAAGVNVDRMSVQHVAETASSENGSSAGSDSDKSGAQSGGQSNSTNPFRKQDEDARREQQRRDLLERLWRRSSGDGLSFVA